MSPDPAQADMPAVDGELQDSAFMAKALQLARRGLYSTDPNPRVGCVLVKDGRIIGSGWHRYAGSAHAEVDALAQAGDAAAGATAYVTLEPCCHFGLTPPCADALIKAAIGRVVVAMTDPNPRVAGQGIDRLLRAGIETRVGLLEEQARAINPGFARRMQGGAPWVRLKIAASIDGRTAMQSGESKWITGQPARADVQRLRARSSAIITGVGTLLEDDPALTVRPDDMGDTGDASRRRGQPCRIILDSRLRTPPAARIFQSGRDSAGTGSDASGSSQAGRVVILCHQAALADRNRCAALEAVGAELVGLDESRGQDARLGWAAIMQWLQTQSFNEVLIEAGATVAGSALQAGVVDELWVYQAPILLGSKARPLAGLPFDAMAQRLQLQMVDQRRVGEDTRTIFRMSENLA